MKPVVGKTPYRDLSNEELRYYIRLAEEERAAAVAEMFTYAAGGVANGVRAVVARVAHLFHVSKNGEPAKS